MNWKQVIAELRAAGYSQAQIAAACKCAQPTICDLASGKTADPRDSIGRALRTLHAKAKRRQQKQAA